MSIAKHEQGKRFEFTVRFLETVKVTDKVKHKWEKTYGSQNRSRFLRYIYPVMDGRRQRDKRSAACRF